MTRSPLRLHVFAKKATNLFVKMELANVWTLTNAIEARKKVCVSQIANAPMTWVLFTVNALTVILFLFIHKCQFWERKEISIRVVLLPYRFLILFFGSFFHNLF